MLLSKWVKKLALVRRVVSSGGGGTTIKAVRGYFFSS